MKHFIALLVAGAITCVAGGLALAHAVAPLPIAGLTPASPFYFLDRFGESIQYFFTFKAEAKARLQAKFAAERVAEAKILVETVGASTSAVEVARKAVLESIDKAKKLTEQERNRGKNVDTLSLELNEEFTALDQELKIIFQYEETDLEAIGGLKSDEEFLTEIGGERERAEKIEIIEIEKTPRQEVKFMPPAASREPEADIIKPAVPEAIQVSAVKVFTIEGDDNVIFPAEIKARRGDAVRITFKTRTTNVYFNGLDFRGGKYFNTGTILPGGMKTIEFTADQSFEFQSYWPASGVLKATGKVVIE